MKKRSPHRWQPTRIPRPWDSPDKNSGVGCHFLLQCMKVKSESEVTQLCLTLSDAMDCSLPGSSVHGIFPGKSTGVGCHHLLQRTPVYQSSVFSSLPYLPTLPSALTKNILVCIELQSKSLATPAPRQALSFRELNLRNGHFTGLMNIQNSPYLSFLHSMEPTE